LPLSRDAVLSRDAPAASSASSACCCWPRRRATTTTNNNSNNATCAARKYVLLCCLCGGLCLALGCLYVAIYFVLDANTTSMHYFQTLPTYVPAIPVSLHSPITVLASKARAINGK
jgi:hypothetical protein